MTDKEKLKNMFELVCSLHNMYKSLNDDYEDVCFRFQRQPEYMLDNLRRQGTDIMDDAIQLMCTASEGDN